jgi:hypothetical protein
MPDYVTKSDLQTALEANKEDFRFALDAAVQTIITEMGIRFGEVNKRLDRMDATLIEHGKQLGAGGRSLAALNEWIGTADADYTKIVFQLTELTLRVAKLERPAAKQ